MPHSVYALCGNEQEIRKVILIGLYSVAVASSCLPCPTFQQTQAKTWSTAVPRVSGPSPRKHNRERSN